MVASHQTDDKNTVVKIALNNTEKTVARTPIPNQNAKSLSKLAKNVRVYAVYNVLLALSVTQSRNGLKKSG